MTRNAHDDEHGSRSDYWDEFHDAFLNDSPDLGPDWWEIEPLELDFDPYDEWINAGGEMADILVDSPPWLHSALYSDYQDAVDDAEPVNIPASVLRALTDDYE